MRNDLRMMTGTGIYASRKLLCNGSSSNGRRRWKREKKRGGRREWLKDLRTAKKVHYLRVETSKLYAKRYWELLSVRNLNFFLHLKLLIEANDCRHRWPQNRALTQIHSSSAWKTGDERINSELIRCSISFLQYRFTIIGLKIFYTAY